MCPLLQHACASFVKTLTQLLSLWTKTTKYQQDSADENGWKTRRRLSQFNLFLPCKNCHEFCMNFLAKMNRRMSLISSSAVQASLRQNNFVNFVMVQYIYISRLFNLHHALFIIDSQCSAGGLLIFWSRMCVGVDGIPCTYISIARCHHHFSTACNVPSQPSVDRPVLL